EDRVAQLGPEVVEPDPLAAQRARDRVGEAEVDREPERDSDERRDEEHCGRDQERGKDAAPLGDVLEPPSAAFPPGHRCHWWARIYQPANLRAPWLRSSSSS